MGGLSADVAGKGGEEVAGAESVSIKAGEPFTKTIQITEVPATVHWQYLVSVGQVGLFVGTDVAHDSDEAIKEAHLIAQPLPLCMCME